MRICGPCADSNNIIICALAVSNKWPEKASVQCERRTSGGGLSEESDRVDKELIHNALSS